MLNAPPARQPSPLSLINRPPGLTGEMQQALLRPFFARENGQKSDVCAAAIDQVAH